MAGPLSYVLLLKRKGVQWQQALILVILQMIERKLAAPVKKVEGGRPKVLKAM